MAEKEEKVGKKRDIPRIDIRKCNSCVICVDSCPVDCLSMTVSRGGIPNHRYPNLLNENICIGCGTCALDCPMDAIAMVADRRKAA